MSCNVRLDRWGSGLYPPLIRAVYSFLKMKRSNIINHEVNGMFEAEVRQDLKELGSRLSELRGSL
ncbi:hypothetical protein MALU111345_09645 [Marinicrinis lubricantis]